MKKTMLILFIGILLIGLVSAFEFDNLKSYDESTKTATFRNSIGAFGIGVPTSTIAKAELLSPSSVNNLFPGYQNVSMLNITSFQEYRDLIKSIRAYQIQSGNSFDRAFDLKYLTIEDVEVTDYKDSCTKIDDCVAIAVGSHVERIAVWNDLTSKDFSDGQTMIIGLFTTVEEGDYVEWIPTIAGREVTEWATFGSSLRYEYNQVGTGSNTFSNPYMEGQSFTIGTVGDNVAFNLTGISINIKSASGSTGKVFLYNVDGSGLPTGSPVGSSGSVTVTSSGSYSWYNFSMNGTLVATSTKYVFLLNNTGANSIVVNVSASSVYAGGSEVECTGDEPSSCGNNARDEVFEVWGTPLNPNPNITLNSPANAFESSISTVTFNITPSDDTSVANASLILNASYNGTNTSGYNATPITFPRPLPDGFWNWSAEVCDGADACINSSTRTFTVDTQNPAVSSNSSGATITFQKINTVLPVYWTISDTNLDSCWIQWYNGTNSTVTCSNNNITINATNFYNPRNLTIWGNDSVGKENSTFVSWDYHLFYEGETYVAHTTEGVINNFTLGVLTNGSTITIANLSYNNGQNIGVLGGSNPNYTIYKTVTAPTVAADTNFTFFWNLSFNDGSYYSLDSHQQNVTSIGVDNCSDYSVVLYNFTLADENSKIELNESVINSIGAKVDLTLYALGTSTLFANYSHLYNQTNPFALCLSNSLASGEAYNVNVQVQYFADSYSTELYNIQNETMNSTNLNQNITLYDLLTANAQVFEIIYRDSSYLPVEDALIEIQRKYIDDGVYRVVERPDTDDKGSTVAFLELNDVIYNFIVKKYGVTLDNFQEKVAICQTPSISSCVINLDSVGSDVSTPNYQQGVDFNYTLGYDSASRTISSAFIVPSGNPVWVTLNVTKEDALGTAACTDQLTTTAGTLSCVVPANIGNATVMARLYKSGSVIAQGQIKLDQLPSDIYAGVLVVLSVLVFLTLIGASLSDNPIVTIVSLLFGVIVLTALNLVANNGFIGGTATILWLIIAVILVVIKGGGRRN